MQGTPEAREMETVLAFDFGLRRIGVAVGQQVTGSASAVATVANRDNGPDWAHIEALIKEWQPQRLIVGMPVNADGKPGSLAPSIDAFCEHLGRFSLPLETVDERLSSQEANAQLKVSRKAGARRRISKGIIDATAAAIIAERWLLAAHTDERRKTE